MTHRFPEDMNFIQCHQIISPFGIDTILQVQRNRGVTPQQPLIIPSSLQSGSEEHLDSMSGGAMKQVILENNALSPNDSPKLEMPANDKKRMPRRSFNLGRDS